MSRTAILSNSKCSGFQTKHPLKTDINTAISINVVGLKRQAYATRPNGGLGIHWNLHIVYSENYKILFLCVKPELAGSAYVCSQESFSVEFLSPLHSFNCGICS